MSRVTFLDIGHVEVEVITDTAGREGASLSGLGASRKCLLDSSYVRDLWEVLGTGSGGRGNVSLVKPLKNSLGTSNARQKGVPDRLHDAQTMAQTEKPESVPGVRLGRGRSAVG